MGLFDRLRKFADRIIGRESRPVEPPIDETISQTWAKAAQPTQPKKPSIFQRLTEGAKNLFRSQEKKERKDKKPLDQAAENLRRFQDVQNIADKEKRKEEIYKFRRSTSDDGNAFYRLTQSIWDVPGVSANQRDQAIFDYYREKYGITDPNEIYDKVLADNADIIERYRNSPNALKYEILKNVKVNEANL